MHAARAAMRSRSEAARGRVSPPKAAEFAGKAVSLRQVSPRQPRITAPIEGRSNADAMVCCLFNSAACSVRLNRSVTFASVAARPDFGGGWGVPLVVGALALRLGGWRGRAPGPFFLRAVTEIVPGDAQGDGRS